MIDRPAADRATASESLKGADSNDARTLICVVDDDESVRDSCRALLESVGFNVTTYASGRDILGDEQRHQACCFIVDHHMPEMDGLATVGALRRDASGALTILITGRLDSDITARATALDVGAVLEKPFSAVRLLELIRAPRAPTR